MGKRNICAKCCSHKTNRPPNVESEPEPESVENYVESPETLKAEVEYNIQSSETIPSGISDSKDLLKSSCEGDESSGFVLDTPQSDSTVRSARYDGVVCNRVDSVSLFFYNSMSVR